MARPYIRRDEIEHEHERPYASDTKLTYKVNGLTALQAASLHEHLRDEIKFKCEVYGTGGNPNAG